MSGLTVTLSDEEAFLVRLALSEFASGSRQSARMFAASEADGMADASARAMKDSVMADTVWERIAQASSVH